MTQPIYPHFGWSFGGQGFASPAEANSPDFRFWFNPSLPKEKRSFREECMNVARAIGERRQGRLVALCYSGGLRSETVAFCLREQDVPFEAYFLDIWGVNGRMFRERRETFEREFGKTVKVVRLERLDFYDRVSRTLFRKYGVDAPTYLAMTELFRAIPEDQFIVTGDGDLQRKGRAFSFFGETNPRPDGASGVALPFLTSSVFYYLWSRENRRGGEFYFYRSSPGIVAAQALHPAFSDAYPLAETNGIFSDAFPEIPAREKSNNWSRESYQENVWIREWLERCAREEKISYWRDNSGDIVPLSGLFN